jgi:hypothetical protein
LLGSFFFSSFFLSSLKNLFSLLFFHLVYLFISIFFLFTRMDTTYCVCSLEILSATKDLERLKKAEEEAQSHVLFGRRLLLGTLNFSLRCPIDERFLTGAGSCMGGLKKLRALAC